jgi:hypothetical protein
VIKARIFIARSIRPVADKLFNSASSKNEYLKQKNEVSGE